MSGIRRQRRSLEGWRALLARFACSGQTVTAFCRHESVSPASFYRWRSLLGSGSAGAHVPVARALPPAPYPQVWPPGAEPELANGWHVERS